MGEKDDPHNVIDIRKKRDSKKPEDWKVTYRIQKSPKKSFKSVVSKDKVIFWIKFFVYIAMISYLLRQCGVG